MEDTYTILEANTKEELCRRVSDKVIARWKPQGGVFVVVIPVKAPRGQNWRLRYYQAMVKLPAMLMSYGLR